MPPNATSRVALASVTTAIAVSMAWIFPEISAEVSVPHEPIWRYTTQGWVDASEWASPPQHSVPGPLDNISPLLWAAIQLFAALVLLISGIDEQPAESPDPASQGSGHSANHPREAGNRPRQVAARGRITGHSASHR